MKPFLNLFFFKKLLIVSPINYNQAIYTIGLLNYKLKSKIKTNETIFKKKHNNKGME